MKRILSSLGAVIILLTAAMASAQAKDKPSQAFLKKAIEGNFAEVSMGDLAQKNGQSDDVKAYGKMLSADHAAANQKALDGAKDLGMNPPTGPNAKQKARLRQDVENVRRGRQNVCNAHSRRPVSYTHLTLPTNREV